MTGEPPPRGLSWADPPCWPQGPQGRTPGSPRGGTATGGALQSRQTSGPLRSHASLHNPDSWEDDPAGREDPPSHGSSAWGHRDPSRAAPGSGTLRTNCSPPPRRTTSLHLSLHFYGLEKKFDKRKKIFSNSLKALRRASHPQACGWKPFSSLIRAGGVPCWCPERLAAGGAPGGSRALVTGLEGRPGPPCLSRQGSSKRCLGALEMLVHSQPGDGNPESQPRCKPATEETQVNHEVGKAGPRALVQWHGLRRAEQAA